MKVIIDGVTYIPEKQEEKKQDRLSGWIKKEENDYDYWKLTESKQYGDDTRMVEIREGEIIVSEDDARKIIEKYDGDIHRILKELFKKDGE